MHTEPSWLNCGATANDGSVEASVLMNSNYPPYSYSWSNGKIGPSTITGLGPGLYTVTVTNNVGCSVIRSIPLSGNPVAPLGVTFIVKPNCYKKANVTGGTSPYTYKWEQRCSPSFTYQTISICDSAPIGSGCDYRLTVTDAAGCFVVVNPGTCTLFKEPIFRGNSATPEIYPNPTKATFQIIGIELADIRVFDLLGNLLYSQRNITEDTEINLERLANGVYIVEITENGEVYNLRLIIEK
jgi:hypothetical protein